MLVRIKKLGNIDKNSFLLEDMSWKSWWEKSQGRSLPTKCSRDGCNQVSADVFPVQKNSDDKTWYMVPLCQSCGNRNVNEEFYVQEDNLQLIV